MDSRLVLQTELSRRMARNPRYSLRAFARAIGIGHTVLSLVLSGKRPLSRKAAAKVAATLELEPAARAAVLRTGERPAPPAPEDGEFQQLSMDAFAAIADWHHYAILSALELPGSRLEPRWISRRLGISVLEARLAIERLKRLALVERHEGRWRQAGKPLRIGNADSTSATRRFHRQLLEKALHSLENDPAERRDFTSMTFAVDPALLPYARKRLTELRRSLVADLEARGGARAVYQLSIQLFPLSQEDSR